MRHQKTIGHGIALLVFTCAIASAWADEKLPGTRDLYFPPASDEWNSVTPAELSINEAALERALEFAVSRNSSSVVILVGGRILAEHHRDVARPSLRYSGAIHGKTTAGHLIEDVASCQKSVTSVLVGQAQEKGLLSISDTVTSHLGRGWSNATPQQESQITIQHLISMTSGLNDRLEFVAPAGSRWAYNTNAYARSLTCVTTAANKSENEVTTEWLCGPLGMQDSKWIRRRLRNNAPAETNQLGFVTSARDLARFGLLMLAQGDWNGREIIHDRNYLKQATSPSQKLNPSYGYLWWLNGQKFALRGRRNVNGPLIPGAPRKLFAAQGALGRKCYVVPSARLVVVRLGDDPEIEGQPRFDQEFWRLLKLAAVPVKEP